MKSDDVFVSSPEYVEELLVAWTVDPCPATSPNSTAVVTERKF
jgi:hypothetical protein